MTFTRRRVVVRRLRPQVDGGRHPAKAVAGEPVRVSADVYADSHDALAAVARWRPAGDERWREAPMSHDADDRWTGAFTPPSPGRYRLTVQAWVDRFATWRRDLRTKHGAGTVEPVDWAVGARVVSEVADAAAGDDADRLRDVAATLADDDRPAPERFALAASEELAALVATHDPRRFATDHDRVLEVRVDRPRARFSTWYELFPRSAGGPGTHGTLRDVIGRLDRVADLGFDVVYLPPIHPIGTTHRKGPDNAAEAGPGDPGSPWAIGSEAGGHTAIHPELGTLGDLHDLMAACRERDMELALDIALQCSPDHPWVTEHPEWFRHRPDGTIQYAENPPKAYQDIYPLDFETDDVEGLWRALRGVFEYWIEQGIRIFRVDNPHTKSLPFWEWCLDGLTREHPDLIVLAEAFTRPKVMTDLAKRGFTQSYTYFPWRQRRWELEQYFTELTSPPTIDFLRGNAWPNTPDILTEQLQVGGRPVFVQRLVLAATLSANYGIYGPPFELMVAGARDGADEYAHNEKYEIRDWDLEGRDSLAEVIGRVNRIRHDHPALQQDRTLVFHGTDNDQLLAFSKTAPADRDVILVVVNLDPTWTQSGFTWLDMGALGLDEDAGMRVHDLLGSQRFLWEGPRNYVELDPHTAPAHIFRVLPARDAEQDFDYF